MKKQDILDYLADASIYEILDQEDETFILVHGGLGGFAPDKNMEEYELYELLEERTAEYGERLMLEGEFDWGEPVGREVW